MMPEATASRVRKFLIALTGVAADDAAHRRIRFERRGIDRDGPALERRKMRFHLGHELGFLMLVHGLDSVENLEIVALLAR